jgi:hypothetical protein
MSDVDQIQQAVILKIAKAAQAIGQQAGVGAMETAGSIVSFLARNPDEIAPFLNGDKSVIDWPFSWHTQGCLSWHAMNGKVVSPEWARQQAVIDRLASPTPEQKDRA